MLIGMPLIYSDVSFHILSTWCERLIHWYNAIWYCCGIRIVDEYCIFDKTIVVDDDCCSICSGKWLRWLLPLLHTFRDVYLPCIADILVPSTLFLPIRYDDDTFCVPLPPVRSCHLRGICSIPSWLMSVPLMIDYGGVLPIHSVVTIRTWYSCCSVPVVFVPFVLFVLLIPIQWCHYILLQVGTGILVHWYIHWYRYSYIVFPMILLLWRLMTIRYCWRSTFLILGKWPFISAEWWTGDTFDVLMIFIDYIHILWRWWSRYVGSDSGNLGVYGCTWLLSDSLSILQ